MTLLQAHTFNVVTGLSALTVFGQVVIAALLATLLTEQITQKRGKFGMWVSVHGLTLMLIVALTATLGSLFFSDIALWSPCKDCWFQRIFMYPQVVLLAIALWKKDRHVSRYILALSIIGLVIAALHYNTQVQAALHPVLDTEGVNVLLKPCDASGVSCAKTEIKFTFGYITLPMMALTAFAMNSLGAVFVLRKKI